MEAIICVTLTVALSILVADVVVFVKCKTYKTTFNLLISLFLLLDLIARISQLCIRLSNLSLQDHEKVKDSQQIFRGFTQYLVSCIEIFLFTQWCLIFQVLKDPMKAVNQSQNLQWEKLSALLITILSIIVLNNFIAVLLISKGDILYFIVAQIVLFGYYAGVLGGYCWLYVTFIKLIWAEPKRMEFLRLHVHVFFVFMIFMELGRIIIDIIQTIIYQRNRDKMPPQLIRQLEYFNIYTECLFNIFILYYFISTHANKQKIENTQSNSDKQVLIEDILENIQQPKIDTIPTVSDSQKVIYFSEYDINITQSQRVSTRQSQIVKNQMQVADLSMEMDNRIENSEMQESKNEIDKVDVGTFESRNSGIEYGLRDAGVNRLRSVDSFNSINGRKSFNEEESIFRSKERIQISVEEKNETVLSPQFPILHQNFGGASEDSLSASSFKMEDDQLYQSRQSIKPYYNMNDL